MKVFILDSNKLFLDSVADVIENMEGYELVGSADNGVDGIRLIKEYKPDVIIMDLLLSGIDGLGVLKSISDCNSKIILTTAMNSDEIIMKAFALGANYVMLKPISADVIGSRIEDIMQTDYSAAKAGEFAVDEAAAAVNTKEDSRRKITKLLNDIGVTPNLKGFRYIRAAVSMVVDNEEIIESVTKTIYPTISTEFKTTPVRVERAIRHAIESSWERDGGETIKNIFGLPANTKRLTNSEFIGLASEYIIG